MLGVLPAAVGFMGIGYIFWKHKNILYKNNLPAAFLIGSAGALIYAYAPISHIANIVNYLYFVCAFCSVYVLFYISSGIKSKFLTFVGQNAILYMGLHIIIIKAYKEQFAVSDWFLRHFNGLLLNSINIIAAIVTVSLVVWLWNNLKAYIVSKVQ